MPKLMMPNPDALAAQIPEVQFVIPDWCRMIQQNVATLVYSHRQDRDWGCDNRSARKPAVGTLNISYPVFNKEDFGEFPS